MNANEILNNNTKESDIILYTPKDIQRIFQCGKKKSYEIMHIPGFPSFKIDSSLYVEKNELEKWLYKTKGRFIATP